ncbi:hydroxymethylglutaryl-CoA synthase [Secundilactobacillus hailunensis]|uniref:Hydroxymethylglutaryl-CoA synthase n=1 Tax=Secundilactobacillus hailunensis TaxID=2559923 RepID=A0ABW1T661_9LACO|nr:hydroxymethylglutaryl-CoA synthase [Secundilactobacillus hailunensis]
MQIGIDQLAFYTPKTYLDLVDLAHTRNQEPDKYRIGIGQSQQAVIPVTQDAVTLAANAAVKIVNTTNRDQIAMVLFGTESGIDNSKSAAVYLQRLLHLPGNIRTIELKQACYGATAGVQFAHDYVRLHPDKQVLVIGADIARYGLNTPGEVTQGGGAVAMTISAEPRLLNLDNETAFKSEDIMDFWRPLYRTEALVDGRFSENVYIDFFKAVWQDYQQQTGRAIADFTAFAFHLPFTKMGLKALRAILPEADETQQKQLMANFEASRVYNRQVGNLYTGSLYLSLRSLFDNATLKPGQRIGLFSYGSGAEGEFFSGTIGDQFDTQASRQWFTDFFGSRQQLTMAQYERVFSQKLPDHDVLLDLSHDDARFVLSGIKHDQRQYVDRGN